jgi:subtilase family serine protease
VNRASVSALVLALTMSGCSGSHATTAMPSVPASASAPVSGSSAGNALFIYGNAALKGAQYVGPASVGSLSLDVTLQPQNAAGLVQYASQVSTPGSPVYRHFLTPTQIGQTYGASQSTVNAVASYFEGYGLHVGTWPQHLTLSVSGSQYAIEKALGTTLATYRQGSTTFIAPSTTPQFSKTLAVTGIGRLVTLPQQYRTLVPSTGTAITAGYSPQQIRNAFDFTGAYNAGYTGSGITIGIVGTGPISSADVPAYGTMFSTGVATVTQKNVSDQGVAAPGIENPPDTGFAPPPPVTAPCIESLPSCNPEDVEAQIDTEAAASLAPNAVVDFYLGYAPGYCIDNEGNITAAPCAPGTTAYPLIGLLLADDEIQQVISDNAVDVLSLSYGGPEQIAAGIEFNATAPSTGLGPMEFAALAAEGITVFVSSGDAGAQGCQRPAYLPMINQACVSYPATDPSVTSVGGVNAPLDRFGNLTNQIIGWGLLSQSGGSGGGVSQYFPLSLTPWQQGVPNVTGGYRNQPDVSLLGDPGTGMAAVINAAFGTQVASVGGTSVAAPEMAAMWALVLQACSQSSSCATAQGSKPYRLGNAAPILYSLYAKGSTIQPTYAQTFYDVLYGDNQQLNTTNPAIYDPGYAAGPNYDQVTGIGVPFARALIKAVTHQ